MFSKNIISYICVIASKCLYGNSTTQLIVNTLHLDDSTNVQRIHSPHSCENCHFKTETDHIIHSTYKLPKFCYFRIKSKTHNHGQRGLTWSNLSLPHLFSLSPWPFPLKKKKKAYSRISSESLYSTDNVNNFKSPEYSKSASTLMQFYMNQICVLRLWFFPWPGNTWPSLRSRPVITSSVMPAWTLTTEIMPRHFVTISFKALKMAARAGTQV